MSGIIKDLEYLRKVYMLYRVELLARILFCTKLKSVKGAKRGKTLVQLGFPSLKIAHQSKNSIAANRTAGKLPYPLIVLLTPTLVLQRNKDSVPPWGSYISHQCSSVFISQYYIIIARYRVQYQFILHRDD